MLFTLLALASLPNATSRSLRARSWLAGAASLAAMASKETGLGAVGLLACLAFAESPGSVISRLKSALRVTAPAGAARVLFVSARTAVLGGLGGHAESSITLAIARVPGVIASYGGISPAEAEASVRLFADEVLPELRAW